MEPIFVTRKNGTIYPLHTKGRMIESAKQIRTFMEEDYVEVVLLCDTRVAFSIGDSMSVFGRTYIMNKLPDVDKVGSRNFKYTIRFEGAHYSMARVAYLLNVTTTSSSLQDVQGNSLIGDIGVFLNVLMVNLNRVFPGKWTLGTYPHDTNADTLLTIDEGENCLSVLQTLCDTFDQEFDVTEHNGMFTLNIRKRNVVFPHSFRYGDHKGLYELRRSNSGSENLINKLWVYGGKDNLTLNYQSDRLLLPNKTRSTSFIKDDTQMALHGVFEGVKVFDDIIPTREGSVTAISSDVKKLVDSTMFNLNEKWQDTTADYQWYLQIKGLQDTSDVYSNYQSHVVNSTKYLIAGTNATLHFNSGKLAGYDFEIASYDHATNTFTLKQSTDERGYKFPSDTDSVFQIAIGDRYTLANIMLPQSYITAAQNRLNTAAQEYLDKMCTPLVKYDLKVDEKYIRWKCPDDLVAIDCGDYVQLTDVDFVTTTTRIRVRSVERNMLSRYSYTLVLEDVNLYRERRKISTLGNIANNNQEHYHLPTTPEGGGGETGQDGTTFIPHVDDNGLLSWTNNGGMENPNPVNIRGPKGEGVEMTHRTVSIKSASGTIEVTSGREYTRVDLYQNTVLYVSSKGNTNEQYMLLRNHTSSPIDVIINGDKGEQLVGDSEITIQSDGYYEVSYIYNENEYIVTSREIQ